METKRVFRLGISSHRTELVGRLRGSMAWIVSLLVTIGIIWFLWTWRLEDNSTERSIIGLILLFFVSWSYLESVVAWWRLSKSEAQLLDAQHHYDPGHNELRVGARSTWTDRAVFAVRSFAASAKQSGLEHMDRLPEASTLIEPVRAQADKSALMLKWFSATSVLIGLLGTIWGLSEAISGALDVLAESSSAQGDITKGFHGALAPLRFAFFASGAGIGTAFGLTMLRIVYERDIDIHLAELELSLASSMPQFFPEWSPPTARFLDAANALSGLNERLTEAIEKIDIKTTTILEEAVATIQKDLAPLPDRMIDTIKEGMKEGTGEALVDIRRSHKEALQLIKELTESLSLELTRASDRLSKEFNTSTAGYTSIVGQQMQGLKTTANQINDLIKEYASATIDLKSEMQKQEKDHIYRLQKSLVDVEKRVTEQQKRAADETERFAAVIKEAWSEAVSGLDNHYVQFKEQLTSHQTHLNEQLQAQQRHLETTTKLWKEHENNTDKELEKLIDAHKNSVELQPTVVSLKKAVDQFEQTTISALSRMATNEKHLKQIAENLKQQTEVIRKLVALDSAELQAVDRSLSKLAELMEPGVRR